jgi:tagatose 6-phosphate kinase
VILAGSTPPGLPTDAYGQLVHAARDARVPVVLDVDGAHLQAALPAAPPLVKVNVAEAAEVTGEWDPGAAARALHAAGAHAAIVTCGPEGLVGLREGAIHHACPPHPVTGNPTGAGDAASAALAVALIDGRPWAEALADAAALSAAAVAAPLAGSFDETLYRRLRAAITARPVD